MKEPDGRRVAPSLEAHVASELSALLAGIPVGSEFTVVPSASLCFSLELFLSQLLCRSHSEWRGESLDGIFVARARKTGPLAAQLAGTCILISDQTVTPFSIELASSPSGDSLASYRVCVGVPGTGRLGISGPGCNTHAAAKLLAGITTRLDRIDWSYTIVSAGHHPH